MEPKKVQHSTPEEVLKKCRPQMQKFDNPDPAVQEEWKKMTQGERPTPEEVINYMIKTKIKNMKKR